MNKTYRIIWNKARGCFMVASENASTNGKPSSKKVLAAAVSALLLSPLPSLAAGWGPNVEVFVRPGSDNSKIGVAGLVPVMQSNDSMFYLDGRYWAGEDSISEFNLGVGYRMFNSSRTGIFGLYGAFDRRSSSTDNNYNQISAGAEYLLDNWEFRGNLYYPITDEKLVGIAPSGGQFSGNNLYLNGIYEEALKGFDVGVGRKFELAALGLSENWLHVGGYHFDGDIVGSTNGYSIRFSSNIRKNITIGAEVQDDDLFGNRVMFDLRYSFGMPSGKGARTLNERMTQLVQRDIDIRETSDLPMNERIDSSSAVDSGEYVVHIDNSAPGGGDGTFESPFASISDCVSADCGTTQNALVYVHAGNSNNPGEAYVANNWTLLDGQKVIGEGYNLFGIGGNDVFPEITNTNGDSYIITLANNNEIAGVELNDDNAVGNIGGINADNVAGFNIHNNRFLDVGNSLSSGYSAINIVRTSAGTTTGTIADNSFFNVGSAIALRSDDASDSTVNLAVTGNSFLAFDSALYIYNMADNSGTSTQNLDIINNSFVSDECCDPAIEIYNYAYASDTTPSTAVQNFNITGNTVAVSEDFLDSFNYAYANADDGARAHQYFDITNNSISADDHVFYFYSYAYGDNNTLASAAEVVQDVAIDQLTFGYTDNEGAIVYTYNYAYTTGAGSVANALSGVSITNSEFGTSEGGGLIYAYNFGLDSSATGGGTATAQQNLKLENLEVGTLEEELAYVYNYAYGENSTAQQGFDLDNVAFGYVYEEGVIFQNRAQDGGTATQTIDLNGLNGDITDYELVYAYNYANAYDADAVATQTVNGTDLSIKSIEYDEGISVYNYAYGYNGNTATANQTNTFSNLDIRGVGDEAYKAVNYGYGDSSTVVATQTNTLSDSILHDSESSDDGVYLYNSGYADGTGTVTVTQTNNLTNLEILADYESIEIQNRTYLSWGSTATVTATQSTTGTNLSLSNGDGYGVYAYNSSYDDDGSATTGQATSGMSLTLSSVDSISEEDGLYVYNNAYGQDADSTLALSATGFEISNDEDGASVYNYASYGGTATMTGSLQDFDIFGVDDSGMIIRNEAYEGSSATQTMTVGEVRVNGFDRYGLEIGNRAYGNNDPTTAASQTVTLSDIEVSGGTEDQGVYVYNTAYEGGTSTQNVTANRLSSTHNPEEGIYVYNNSYGPSVATSADQTFTLTNGVVNNNAASGVYVYNSADDAFADSTQDVSISAAISNNASYGGVFVLNEDNGDTATQTVDLTGSQITNNYANIVIDDVNSDPNQTVTLPDGTVVSNP